MIIEAFLRDGSIMELENGNYLIGYGQRTWLSEPVEPSFIFSDFFLEAPQPWCTHEEIVEVTAEELYHLLYEGYQEVSLAEWKLPEPFLFARTFKELQSAFEAGELKKAVPYMLIGSAEQMTPARLRHSLLHGMYATKHRATRLYGYWHEKGGLLGLTPEPLLKLNEHTLTTVACAGTCAPNVEISEFLQDPKELHEHQVVVDAIIEALEPFGEVETGERRIVDLTLLRHLITPITVQLAQDTDVLTLLDALHPTPALGAYPKEAGMKWLKHYQTLMPRKHFGAPVGYTRNQITECLVAIRNVQWTQTSMAIAAGCGVVPQSQCEREWKEILLKTQTIQQTLGLTTRSLPVPFSNTSSTVA